MPVGTAFVWDFEVPESNIPVRLTENYTLFPHQTQDNIGRPPTPHHTNRPFITLHPPSRVITHQPNKPEIKKGARNGQPTIAIPRNYRPQYHTVSQTAKTR